jgi:hypothetical protein
MRPWSAPERSGIKNLARSGRDRAARAADVRHRSSNVSMLPALARWPPFRCAVEHRRRSCRYVPAACGRARGSARWDTRARGQHDRVDDRAGSLPALCWRPGTDTNKAGHLSYSPGPLSCDSISHLGHLSLCCLRASVLVLGASLEQARHASLQALHIFCKMRALVLQPRQLLLAHGRRACTDP